MRNIKLTGLILLLLLTFGCVQISATGYQVTRVVDGDTFVIEGGERVRMIGIDTPETVKPGVPPQPYGKEASNFTKKLLAGKRVELEFDVQKRDKYGRLLAYVYVGKTFVNAELVKVGLARVATYPPNVKHQELFVRLQQEARQAKRGMWQKDPFPKDGKKNKGG